MVVCPLHDTMYHYMHKIPMRLTISPLSHIYSSFPSHLWIWMRTTVLQWRLENSFCRELFFSSFSCSSSFLLCLLFLLFLCFWFAKNISVRGGVWEKKERERENFKRCQLQLMHKRFPTRSLAFFPFRLLSILFTHSFLLSITPSIITHVMDTEFWETVRDMFGQTIFFRFLYLDAILNMRADHFFQTWPDPFRYTIFRDISIRHFDGYLRYGYRDGLFHMREQT